MSECARRTITFYCGAGVEPWGPDSLGRGIGGSEEALIHMAAQLRDLGWGVEVYGDPPASCQGLVDGIAWHSYRDFQPDRPGDVFIAWRAAEFLRFGGAHRQAHHWLHNHQEEPYPPDLAALVDRILVVSEHHARDPGFEAIEPGKIYATRNGLQPDFLRDPGANEPRRAIYASCPARGLLTVLEMWPRIRREVPGARLDVYHGFTPVYEEMARYYPGLTYIKELVLQRLDQPGVRFHGMVGQHELAEGFACAGVWVYPTETDETSCITAMKALAMGCLPVTSGFGALPETLGGRDLGPVDPRRPISRSRWRLWRFRRRVVQLMKKGDKPRFRALRSEWSKWARERYSWREIATEWCQLFAEVEYRKRSVPPGAPESRDSINTF